jgi:type III secretion system YscQ/HrcQ family protein
MEMNPMDRAQLGSTTGAYGNPTAGASGGPYVGPHSDTLAGHRASRARLLAALPRMNGTMIAVRNRAYQSAPCMVTGDRVLIWQDSGPIKTIGELSCRVGDAPLALAADSLSRIEPRLEGFESFVPTDTCTALVEHALSPILSVLERLAGVPVECDEFRRGPPPGGGLVGSLGGALSSSGGATHPSGSEGVTVGYVLYESSLQQVLRGWVRTTPEVWHSMDFSRLTTLEMRRHQSVPARLSIELGRCRLSARELDQLAPGDALRPANRIPRDSSSLSILLTNTSGRFALAASVCGDELILEKSVNTDVNTSAAPSLDDPNAMSEAPGNDLLSDIECDLSFELGSMRLTVADIARMRAGQTMRLGVRLQEQPVRLLVNGRLIGRGELAAVGDELVVVVTDTSRLPHI